MVAPVLEKDSQNSSKKVIVANPHGFCAGVSRAIATVKKVLERFPNETVYVLHEVVHNQHVVQDLSDKGAVFTDHLSEIPENSIVVFSAHGVSQKVVAKAERRHLRIFDATCPIVERVHRRVRKMSALGADVIMIGHAGHQEVAGTLGQYDNVHGSMNLIINEKDIPLLSVKNTDNISFVTQTTLSVDETKNCIEELRKKFPGISGPGVNDICYATQNRQNAVKELAEVADVVLVVGSKNSSNSNRLREVSEQCGTKAFLVNDYTEVEDEMLQGVKNVGVTGGASAPEYLLNDLLGFLKTKGFNDIHHLGEKTENQRFKLPDALEN